MVFSLAKAILETLKVKSHFLTHFSEHKKIRTHITFYEHFSLYEKSFFSK